MYGKEVHKGRVNGGGHHAKTRKGRDVPGDRSKPGVSRAEVRGAVKRWRRKCRQIAAGYKPLPKGRPRKDADNEEAKRNNEVVQLRMTPELLRNFLSEAGRR